MSVKYIIVYGCYNYSVVLPALSALENLQRLCRWYRSRLWLVTKLI